MWHSKNDYDSSFLGPILFNSLVFIVLFGIVHILSFILVSHHRLENNIFESICYNQAYMVCNLLEVVYFIIGCSLQNPIFEDNLVVSTILSIISGYSVVDFQRSLEACHIQSFLLSNQLYKLDMGDLQHHSLTPFLCKTLTI